MGEKRKKTSKKCEDDEFLHLNEAREEQDVSGIIPYDIDKQVSYMEDVLEHEAPLEKILSFDGGNKSEGGFRDPPDFSFARFWKQMHELELSLCLIVCNGRLRLVGSTDILLNGLEFKEFEHTAAVLTRKATPIASDKDVEKFTASPNLNKKVLFPIFAKDIFSVQGIFKKSDSFPMSDVFSNLDSEDILKISNVSQTEHGVIKVVFFINGHINKYILLKQSKDESFHKEREEMREKDSPRFKIQVSEPGTYCLSFYELLGPDSGLKSNRDNMVKHDYIFRLSNHFVQVSEFPYQKMIKIDNKNLGYTGWSN